MFTTEHLKRVHSLRVSCCVTCKLRFHRRTRAEAEQAEREHHNTMRCIPRELTLAEPEWMSAEQDARFSSCEIQGQSLSAEEKWRVIYRQLFQIPEHGYVPDPCMFILRLTTCP